MTQATDKGLLISDEDLLKLEGGLAAILDILTTPIKVLIAGVTGWLLWPWFLTPVFGLSRPGLPMLIGTVITVRFLFTSQSVPPDPEKKLLRKEHPLRTWALDFRNSVMGAVIILVIGFVLANWPTLF